MESQAGDPVLPDKFIFLFGTDHSLWTIQRIYHPLTQMCIRDRMHTIVDAAKEAGISAVIAADVLLSSLNLFPCILLLGSNLLLDKCNNFSGYNKCYFILIRENCAHSLT